MATIINNYSAPVSRELEDKVADLDHRVGVLESKKEKAEPQTRCCTYCRDLDHRNNKLCPQKLDEIFWALNKVDAKTRQLLGDARAEEIVNYLDSVKAMLAK